MKTSLKNVAQEVRCERHRGVSGRGAWQRDPDLPGDAAAPPPRAGGPKAVDADGAGGPKAVDADGAGGMALAAVFVRHPPRALVGLRPSTPMALVGLRPSDPARFNFPVAKKAMKKAMKVAMRSCRTGKIREELKFRAEFHAKKKVAMNKKKKAQRRPAATKGRLLLKAEAKKAEAKKEAMKAMDAEGDDMLEIDIASDSGVAAQDVCKVLNSLHTIACQELRITQKFVIPQLATLTLKHESATKAGKRMMFGKEVRVLAKPAKKVLKAFPAKALKDSI